MTKKCHKCKREFPATDEFFVKDKRRSLGLGSECIECKRQRGRDYQQRRRQDPDTLKRDRAATAKWFKNNKSKKKEYAKKDYEKHKDKYKERRKNYYWSDPERFRLATKEWKDGLTDTQWQELMIKRSIQTQKRTARKRELPDTFTLKDWKNVLQYFNYECPICNCSLISENEKLIAHMDHWIPLSSAKCPGTIPQNIICLCGSCNSSKHKREAYSWISGRFGEQKALEVKDIINAFWGTLKP